MKIQALLLGVASTIAWGGVNVAPSYAINLIGNFPSNDGAVSTLNTTLNYIKAVSFGSISLMQ